MSTSRRPHPHRALLQ